MDASSFIPPLEPLSTVNLQTGIYVFLVSILIDILWTFGIRRAAQGKAAQSALFSGAITLASGLVVTEYVRNLWYLIPSALGAMLGNYLSVLWDTYRPNHFANHLKSKRRRRR